MKLRITAVLLVTGLAHVCWGRDSQTKNLPPECTKPIRTHGSYPKGPFKIPPGESYKRSPTIKYEIQEDGAVTNAIITRKSGVADIDKKFLDSISRWKYKPRPPGCGVIENEMSVTILHPHLFCPNGRDQTLTTGLHPNKTRLLLGMSDNR